MTSREFTIAFELAIGLFALYLLVRRLSRLAKSDHTRDAEPQEEHDSAEGDGPTDE